ncbi:DNA methyltransferase/helicase [Candidatus Vecturithrix granuli]|uniref:site-specific DNA-methyltransferase (adenine-specific) n=1 Tax=Vecturithrix granuli TaxID=1499967 RepID=A0A081C4K6_VECG1|nr:DNA methyltransferase/helicase [Candidatus Vecturithrix granuli]
MSANFKHYLNSIETALKAGNATEHTHRPALKALIESFDSQMTAVNEPKRIACGAPDYIVVQKSVTLGYLEAKDVGLSLDDAERSAQVQRYRRALDNLILTDYLEFRWYVGGDLRQYARLARLQSGGQLKAEKDAIKAVEDLLRNFLTHRPQGIHTPKDLAQRMARLTHIIRDIIIAAFETKRASLLLQGWREAFARVLIADLNEPEKTPDFADMFAQTLAYGLFTARVMDSSSSDMPSRLHSTSGVPPTETSDEPVTERSRGAVVLDRKSFSRQKAQYLIPKSNPFLRDFFIQISGPQLDDEPFVSFVEDLVHLLAHTDMAAVLTDFGRRTKQEDPVVHFYETFLAAYDPKLREARGVYYTPEPVVSYIVRSVDYLLKTRFDCPQGLADSRKIHIPNEDPGLQVKGKKQIRKTTECHKVLILDPAAGTGAFLYAVIDHIRRQFMQQGNAGMWPGYVKNHLLPRLFGFELLMAPYAVAHFKLSLQLAGRDLPEAVAVQWAYYPADGDRLGIYLTNALEEAHAMTGLPLFTQWVADESNAANAVKQRLPVLVVMGNPPYSVSSSNKSLWIENLMKSYKHAVRSERNIQPLSDDYIKFIRLAQDRIERTAQGIVGIITNHAYLSGLIHRGMRAELLNTFSAIYVLNLHGSATIGEIAPDGGADENVFDIRQGVAIALFVKAQKQSGPAEVKFFELWGKREEKYDYLRSHDLSTTNWQTLTPQEPYYFFVPKDFNLIGEYEDGWKLSEIFPQSSLGIEFGSKQYLLAFDADTIETFVSNTLLNPQISDYMLEEQYGLKTTSGWRLQQIRQIELVSGYNPNLLVQCSESPFNILYTYHSLLLRRPQLDILQNLHQSNKALLTLRQTRTSEGGHFFAVNTIYSKDVISIKDRVTGFPLYLYPTEDAAKQKSLFDVSPWPADEAHGGRVPNLNPKFVAEMARKLGLTFTPNRIADANLSALEFTPEDIFHYIYAIFHSPTYRTRYTEFLKIDFPRVPLTSDVVLFRSLCDSGKRLVALHLLESPEVGQFITRYPVAGDNRIEKGYPAYTPTKGEQAGRVKINAAQYFEGVPPEVWEFYIGGYQPAQKWLKDRRGRQLSYDDLSHYQKIVAALHKTGELMQRIDELIQEWPVE